MVWRTRLAAAANIQHDRAGAAADHLVRPRASQSAAARKMAEWLTEEAQRNIEGELSVGAGGTIVGERSVGGTTTKKTKGRRA